MKIAYEQSCLFIGNAPLDLRLTLMDSAQAFHWIHANNAYYGFIDGMPFRVRPEPDRIVIGRCRESDTNRLIDYFDLERDYAALTEQYRAIDCANKAFEMLGGLRVLNQNPWTALFSFILSANNNAARIRSLVLSLSQAFGEAAEIDGVQFFDIPSPAMLIQAGESALRALGCGYRAPYLIGTSKRIEEGFPIDSLRKMTYDEAHRLLIELPGVGDKVADCVQLFGCGHTAAFPVDIWVERLLYAWFPQLCREKMSRKKLSIAAREHLGEGAGLLQQYLFHCARLGLIDLDCAMDAM